MGAPKFQYKKPLVVKLGTGVSGSRTYVFKPEDLAVTLQ